MVHFFDSEYCNGSINLDINKVARIRRYTNGEIIINYFGANDVYSVSVYLSYPNDMGSYDKSVECDRVLQSMLMTLKKQNEKPEKEGKIV